MIPTRAIDRIIDYFGDSRPGRGPATTPTQRAKAREWARRPSVSKPIPLSDALLAMVARLGRRATR